MRIEVPKQYLNVESNGCLNAVAASVEVNVLETQMLPESPQGGCGGTSVNEGLYGTMIDFTSGKDLVLSARNKEQGDMVKITFEHDNRVSRDTSLNHAT